GTPNRWTDRHGDLSPAFLEPEFLEANRSMREMIEAGHVNPDLATMDSGTWNEPCFNGEGGLIADVSSRGLQLRGLFKEEDADTLDRRTWHEPFFHGEGGLLADVASRGLQLLGLFKDEDPDTYGDMVTMVGNLRRDDGEMFALPTPGYSGYLAIPKASVPTEE